MPVYTKAFRPVCGSLHPLPLHPLPLHPLHLHSLSLHLLSLHLLPLHLLPLHPFPLHPFHKVDQTIRGATYICDAVFLLLLIENCDSKYELKYQGDEGACLDASLEDGDRGEKGGIFGLWPPAGVRSLLSDTRNSNPLPLACHFVFYFVIVVF